MNFTHEYGRTNTEIHCKQRKSGEVWLCFIFNQHLVKPLQYFVFIEPLVNNLFRYWSALVTTPGLISSWG